MSDPCPVREYCSNRACEGVDGQWITQENCNCKRCIQRSIDNDSTLTPEIAKELCEWSGDQYNTDGDCLAEK